MRSMVEGAPRQRHGLKKPPPLTPPRKGREEPWRGGGLGSTLVLWHGGAANLSPLAGEKAISWA